MKEIPIQKLADELGISRVTVWKALNNKPGVSAKTLRRILDTAQRYYDGQLTFSDSAPIPVEHKTITNISLLLSRASSSSFWMRMLNQIAYELNQNKINLYYSPIDDLNDINPRVEELINTKQSQGLIIVNVYDKDTIERLRKMDIPKVYFDTLPQYQAVDLAGDLFLLNGHDPIAAITSELISKGCKTIGFIGDIYYAKTNHLRWEGFLTAMQTHQLPVEPSICYTGPIPAEAYKESIAKFINGLNELPDAFVCASDFVTFTVLNHLSSKGIRVPEDIILTGYDNSKDFLLGNHGITTVQVQNEQLGKRLIHQLSYRIENPNADYEEITITPQILEIN